MTAGPPDRRTLRRALRWGFGLALGAVGLWAVLALDAVARSREAYRAAEGYARAALDPEAHRRELDRELLAAVPRGADEPVSLDLLREKHALALGRPAAAAAHQWYTDAYRLFAPPETPWTRAARLMAPAMKELWRRDAAARRLPLRDVYFDEEPGLDADERVVYSARRASEAARALSILSGRGLPGRTAADPRPAGAGDGVWVVVPTVRFAESHAALREELNLAVPPIVIQFP